MIKILGRSFIFIPLLIIISSSETQYAQSESKITLPKGYEERLYEDLRYGIFIPYNYNNNFKYPLIIYLHGSTDTVSWDLSWYHDTVQAKHPCFIMTPKSLMEHNGWGTSWDKEHSRDMKNTLKVVGLLMKEYSIDPNRLYIYGASMGGFGVFSVLAKEPGMFAAAFSICGGGDPITAGNLVGTPFWIFHGSDDNVVPVDLSRNMYKAILDNGSKTVRYTEYSGVGHASWTPAWKEPSLQFWLLSQVKGKNHKSPDPPANLNYEITGKSIVKITWKTPSDTTNPDNAIWYYKLFRNNKTLAELNHLVTSYVDSSLDQPETYTISAVNYYFNESKKITAKEIFP